MTGKSMYIQHYIVCPSVIQSVQLNIDYAFPCVSLNLYIPCHAGIDYVFHCVLFTLYIPVMQA